MNSLLITQGQFATGTDPDTVISTLLGSCVSCCLWDPVKGVGGMNHILLAKSHTDEQWPMRSGINEMEILINALIKIGAERHNLKAKAFGGACMVRGLSDIGAQNAEFIVGFLEREGIPLTSKSFGGSQARSLKFWPATGRLMQKLTNAQIQPSEQATTAVARHDVEIFLKRDA